MANDATKLAMLGQKLLLGTTAMLASYAVGTKLDAMLIIVYQKGKAAYTLSVTAWFYALTVIVLNMKKVEAINEIFKSV